MKILLNETSQSREPAHTQTNLKPSGVGSGGWLVPSGCNPIYAQNPVLYRIVYVTYCIVSYRIYRLVSYILYCIVFYMSYRIVLYCTAWCLILSYGIESYGMVIVMSCLYYYRPISSDIISSHPFHPIPSLLTKFLFLQKISGAIHCRRGAGCGGVL